MFVRSRAGVRPTAAGAAFITSVRRVVQEIEGIATMARAAGRGEVGRITIGFYTSLSTGNLRATLLDYIERFPKVEIGILQGSRAELFTAIDNGTLDIAIVTGEPNGPHRRSMALWSERIVVALPEGHPLAAQETVFWTALKSETFRTGRRRETAAVPAPGAWGRPARSDSRRDWQPPKKKRPARLVMALAGSDSFPRPRTS